MTSKVESSTCSTPVISTKLLSDLGRHACSLTSPYQTVSRDNLSDLIHHIGHEIGNPLTAVISLASLVERMAEDGRKKTLDIDSAGTLDAIARYAGSLLGEAWRISHLSQQMVMLLSQRESRNGMGKISDLISQAIRRLEKQSGLSSARITVELPDPEVRLQGEPQQIGNLIEEMLKQVWLCLSKDFSLSPSSSAERAKISLSAERIDQEGAAFLSLSVSFPRRKPWPQDLADLFKPFNCLNEDARSAGLGLCVCCSIAERLGGHIEITESLKPFSETDAQGSQITIFTLLPIAQSSATEVEDEHPSASGTQKSGVGNDKSRPIKILILDDEEIVVSAIERIVVFALGTECKVEFCVASGDDSFSRLTENIFYDLVLCDLNLSRGVSGLDVFWKVNQTTPDQSSRFVFLTGQQYDTDLEKRLDKTGRPVIYKPFDAKQLASIVKEVVINNQV